jgi:hypothetical protein
MGNVRRREKFAAPATPQDSPEPVALLQSREKVSRSKLVFEFLS